MKRTILYALVGAFFLPLFLAAQSNPSSYYRKIASEQRKLRTKQINYYETALINPEPRRLEKGREVIVNQINTSLKNMKRIPAYKGDSAMRNDYVRILKTYLEAYTTAYDSVQKMREGAGTSSANLIAYRESIYYMEGLVDECEYDWSANEDYFASAYGITKMDDPTLVELNTLRGLSDYVQEMRGTYTAIPFLLVEIRHELKNKKYGALEDKRQELGAAADQALVSAGRVDVYFDDDNREDDFLLVATLRYLDEIKIVADEEMAEALTDLDEALYDEDEKKIERYSYELEGLIDDLDGMEFELNDRIEKFVRHYVKE